MQHYGFALAPAVLLTYLKRTFLVMLGRLPVKGTFLVDAAGLWQAIWASLIFTLLVSLYPGMSHGAGLIFANMLMQVVAVLLMVVLFFTVLNAMGLQDRALGYIVPFLWIENVQHLFAGLVQNIVIVTGKPNLLMLITPMIIWSVYWLWRLGREQLQRGGWISAGFLALSFGIDLVLFFVVQQRLQLPTG
jgi:hypothetical protein